MRPIVLTILPFLAIFLQSTFFSSYSIKGTVPDIVLVFVTFFALLNGPNRGAVYGMLCGLLEDLYMGRLIGINSLSKGLVAYIVGRLQGNVFKENILVGIMVVIMTTVINALLVLLIAAVGSKVFDINPAILSKVLYETIYNGVIAAPFYVWYYNSTKNGWLRESRGL